MSHKARLAAAKAVALALALWAVTGGSASAFTNGSLPQREVTLSGHDLTTQGASPLRTDRTIPYWHGEFTDQHNGQTYGFNMVGADPSLDTSTTVQVDVVPIDLTFKGSGYSLRGSDVAQATLASPVFQAADFNATAAVTGSPDSDGHVSTFPGGALSAGNSGVQYVDAVMRSEFDKVGTSYHLRLHSNLLPSATINVPSDMGAVFQNPRGATYAQVANEWLSGQFQAVLGKIDADPGHLVVFLTKNVLVGTRTECCFPAFHGATRIRSAGHSASAGGDQPVQTWIFASYLNPALYNPFYGPFTKDVLPLGHELSEWAHDPFITNFVSPWSAPIFPQYCLNLMETGDGLELIDFVEPGNSFDGGPYADGSWHLQDESLLPWFARESPNTTSQATQQPSTNLGRYTFLGDLNPVAGFHQPAVTC